MARRSHSTRRKPKALLRGILDCRDGKNAFVATSEGDFFVPESSRGGASDGDLVEVAPASGAKAGASGGKAANRGRRLGRVVRVIERSSEVICGHVELADPFAVVVPDNPGIPFDVFTLRADAPQVPEGAYVQVRITQFPTRRSACTGVIEAVLAEDGQGSGGIDLIVARHKLETVFSEAALAEAAAAAVNEAEALAESYRDLRERKVFTIDPADAKDFDDALSLERVRDGQGRELWRLGVHIADVSAYVPWNSSLDIEARRRATSVYLADRVIPMLPPALSEDVCSLRPGEVRRAFTADLLVTDQGQVLHADFYPSLIRSRVRFTYDQVQELLDAPGEGMPEGFAADEAMAAKLRSASHLAERMAQRRTAAGGIDFSTVEAKVVLDAEGTPIDVRLREKTAATSLVEEAMIAANEAVARFLSAKDFPCLYRVHEEPSPDALAALMPVFREFSWYQRANGPLLAHGSPFVIQDILRESHGRAEEELVSNLLLRAMKRAVYRPVNDGHYGLASKAYCHFTSPIRRYPDLVAHRMLKAALIRRPQLFDQEVSSLTWIGEHSSDMERVAETAARESQELKLAEFLEPRTGETFAGVISGVSSQGLFVRLDRGVTSPQLALGGAIEGFVPVRCLGEEYFVFDPDRYTLTGADTDQVFRLGQPLDVVLSRVDMATSRLDLRL
ncbi:MAG: VacB/RNase II family 3'-5' exoribonuclease [Eggerthellaceae bacterium]|nr:VacB/RNase II family 3'-5' exoribonuclease [Eggerthellaceae bacterium]